MTFLRRYLTFSALALGLALGIWFLASCIQAFEEPLDESAIAGCSTKVSPPTPRSRPLPGAVKILPPAEGAYAGLYMLPAAMSEYRRFSEMTGGRPPLLFTGQDWVSDQDFGKDDVRPLTFEDRFVESDEDLTPSQLAGQLAKEQSILAFGWAIYCCDVTSMALVMGLQRPWNIFSRILDGEFDSYIRTVARQIKAFGSPIMLTLTGEFNGQGLFLFGKDGTESIGAADNICNEYGDPSWPDGPERIRDTYMHVIDIFREEGVRNVTWFMYASSNYMDEDPAEDVWLHPQYFYPGDAYIDWVGQSAYFVDLGSDHGIDEDAARDFAGAVQAGYDAWGTVTQRPMFLPEFGAMADGRTSRAKLIERVFRDELPRYPRIKAVTLGDSDLFAEFFALPRLGNFPDELTAWRGSVTRNPFYVDTVRVAPLQKPE